MKIGCNISIDVTKIDKDRLYHGKKGKYLNLTAFIDLEQQSQYGDNGTVSQSTSKEERQNAVKMPIIGNVKVFYRDESAPKEPDYQEPENNDDLPW